MALTLDDVRARVETDFDDPTLLRILDAAVEDLDRQAGDPTGKNETHLAMGSRYISLGRRAQTISTITERRHLDTDPVTLAADDWRRVGDYRLLRSAGGTNSASCWGAEVIVNYAPEIDAALRDRVTLDVVQMDVEFRALQSEGVGDWDGDQADHEKRRTQKIAEVREGRSPLL